MRGSEWTAGAYSGVAASVGRNGLLICALVLFWGQCYSHALEEWRAGVEGTPWRQVIDDVRSQNVEVTPQGWLQPERVDSTRNLCLNVYDRGGWYTGAGSNLVWSGSINGAFDGDPNTAAIINRSRGRITVDLGAPFPVNRIRFYPRSDFPLRFIPGFEIFVNNGAQPPSFAGMDMWQLARVTTYGSVNNIVDWERLYERRENLEREVDLSFDRQYIRFVQVADFEQATWEFAELEVYGEGYVGEATFVSEVIDLGGTADFGDVTWDLELDPGAEAVLRSRSGRTSDPFLYYRLTGIGPTGQSRVLDENGNGTAWDEYNRLRDDQGDMVLDVANWSYWSAPYVSARGVEEMLSPGPRRYVQFQLRFRSGNTFGDGVRVRTLALEYARPPIADEIVGEVAPGVVEPGQVTTFTYAAAGTFAPGQVGFDVLEISTPVTVDPGSVRDLSVDGVPVNATVQVEENLIVVGLPDKVRRTGEVVTLRFDCPVFVPGTRFGGKVFDSANRETGQQVVSGDASADINTNELAVTWPLEGDLIGSASVAPAQITPNGDGVNDAAVISFGVLQLLDAAMVSVQIYDLHGGLVWQIRERRSSGTRSVVWPAVDGNGDRVPPGLYVYRLAVDAEAGYDSRTGVLAVAY